MKKRLEIIAFDGDDTLWEDISFFHAAVEKVRGIIERHTDPAPLSGTFRRIESEALSLFGYGTRTFVLSMIEAAVEATGGRVGAAEIQEILDIGKTLVNHPVEPLPGVRETLAELARSHRLMLLTKGDRFEQEKKIRRSGLAHYFQETRIVDEKDEAAYRAVLARWGVVPEQFLMVGNSARSDILPVLGISGNAVCIPHPATWYHEQPEEGAPRFPSIDGIGRLPGYVRERFFS